MQSRSAPVKEGQVVDLQIEAVGEKGDGIGKIEGFVVIVPNTKVGETYCVKITKVRQKVSFGEIVSDEEKDEENEDTSEEEKKEEESEPEDTEDFGEDE